MTHDNEERRPAGNGTALKNRLTTYPDSTPSTPVDEASRCLACARPITAAKSIAGGRGPVCEERYRLECARSATAGVLENLAVVVESAPLLSLRQLGRALWDLEQEFYWPAVDALAAEGVRRG